jgi:hypothetical protein
MPHRETIFGIKEANLLERRHHELFDSLPRAAAIACAQDHADTLMRELLRIASDDPTVLFIMKVNRFPATAIRRGNHPTAGVVWRSGSAVGHSIKYAQRQLAADGGETVTLVTDKPIGSTSFTPWVAEPSSDPVLAYSVVELDVPAAGSGEGTLSLAAEVRIDTGAGTVALDRGNRAALLKDVAKQPGPYSATDD